MLIHGVSLRIGSLYVLFAFMLVCATAQEQAAATTTTTTTPAAKMLRVMVVAPQSIDEEKSPAVDPVASLLTQSMHNNLASRSLQIVDLGSSESLFVAAKKAEAQAAISVSYFREGSRITLIGKLYDVWQERFLSGATLTSQDDISLLTSCDSLMVQLLDKLASEKDRLIASWGNTDSKALSRELVLTGSQDGVLVSLEGGTSLGTIQNGKLILPFRPLALGQTTTLNLEKPGYYSRRSSFIADNGTPEVKLDALYPKSQWTALIYVDPDMIFPSENNKTSLDLGLDAALRFYPIPDVWYLRLDYGLKKVKSQITGTNIAQPDWTVHEFSLATAITLMPPDWFLRAYVGVGFGLFLTYNGQGTSFIDPWIELPVLDIEINIHPIVVDFGLGAIFDINTGTNLFPEGLVQSFGLIRMGVGFKW